MNKLDTHEIEYRKLDERVKKLIAGKVISRRSQAPIYLLLKHHFYTEDDLINESYTDGGNDCGVDGIFIERKRDQPLVHIIQAKYHESLRKSSQPFKASSLDKILKFFEILKRNDLILSKVCNAKIEQKILEIRELQECDFPEFKVWLISNGLKCTEHEIAPTLGKLKREAIQVEEFHLQDFIEFCINRKSLRTEHIIFARDDGIIEHGPSELRSVVGYISARELYKLLKDLRDERKIDYALFDLNVRGFLGLDNSINKEIFKSASSSENIHFSSFNNGITIIGTSFKIMRGADQYKIGIKNLNIVNGAQTCSAIFDAMKDYYPDFDSFDKLSVLFRVFATDDRDLIDKIALSTNSQNKVNPRDLKANDKIQVELERSLLMYGIKYVRKRGEYDYDQIDLEQLDALKAGQIIISYIHREPARAKRDSDAIFAEDYGKIFQNLDIQKLLEGYKLFKLIEQKREMISEEIRIRGSIRTENTFVTYGGFHILAACSVLKESHPTWNDEKLIDESINIIAQLLRRKGMPAYYTFFRDPEISKQIINETNQLDLFS